MDFIYSIVVLIVLGLMFGSFAGATVWRLRARQLAEDKEAGEVVESQEYDRLLPLTNVTVSSDRSRCLKCGHILTWYDLLPLVSWLSVSGKCRYCKSRIGALEPLIELGVATMFVASFLFWPEPLTAPLAMVQFGLWLTAVVMLAILFAYDFKWFLLPDRVVFPLVALGVMMSSLRLIETNDIAGGLVNAAGAVVILSGLYYFLWLISIGQWIGFGDVKLGLALGLLLGDWKLALIALFGANLIGSLLVIPGMITGRIDRKSHVPFGPLLIAGAALAMLFGDPVVSWYQTAIF